MHGTDVATRVRALAHDFSDAEIAMALGLARTTVRDIRHRQARPSCPRCWAPIKPVSLTPEDYAELLGLYFGDGHVLRVGRSFRLRISLDARYPGIVADARDLVARCSPRNATSLTFRDRSTAIVAVNHVHLPCVLPQHAAGSRKHERPMILEGWQRDIVFAHPSMFLRGCIRSDGCVYVNRTGAYEYLSYDFSNRSADLRRLFADVCAHVGVECRTYSRNVRIYRRASVALMLAYVGVKR